MSVSSAEVWKQVPSCSFANSGLHVASAQSSHHRPQACRACVIGRLCNGRTEALSCSEFHGETPACSAVCKWRLQCLLLYRLRIYRRPWVGECWGEEDSKCGPQSREQGVGPLKKLPTTPDQCCFSLCPQMALVEPRLALSMLSCRWRPSVPHL